MQTILRWQKAVTWLVAWGLGDRCGVVARGGTAGYERYEETFSGDMLVIVIVVRVSRVIYIYICQRLSNTHFKHAWFIVSQSYLKKTVKICKFFLHIFSLILKSILAFAVQLHTITYTNTAPTSRTIYWPNARMIDTRTQNALIRNSLDFETYHDSHSRFWLGISLNARTFEDFTRHNH